MRGLLHALARRLVRPHALAIAACGLALALPVASPAPAHALAVRATRILPLTADVPVEMTAEDPAGLGLLFVDGGLASSVRVSPSRPATFTGVRFTPGAHTLRVLVRSRAGLAASPATTVACWGTPAAPVALRVPGLCPPRTALQVRVEGAERLSVLVDGVVAFEKAVKPSAVVPATFPLKPGAHTVVLRACNPLASTSTTLTLTRPVWPVPGCTRITSPFGWRVHPILGTRRFHAGLDIAAPSGSRVIATGAGRVTLAGVNGGYGNCVIVDHGGGFTTLHGHLSRIDVKAGQKVSLGQRIGLVGTTGLSTGPHLHYELRIDGTPKDPLGYL